MIFYVRSLLQRMVTNLLLGHTLLLIWPIDSDETLATQSCRAMHDAIKSHCFRRILVVTITHKSTPHYDNIIIPKYIYTQRDVHHNLCSSSCSRA